jgi:hypothetical protein
MKAWFRRASAQMELGTKACGNLDACSDTTLSLSHVFPGLLANHDFVLCIYVMEGRLDEARHDLQRAEQILQRMETKQLSSMQRPSGSGSSGSGGEVGSFKKAVTAAATRLKKLMKVKAKEERGMFRGLAKGICK